MKPNRRQFAQVTAQAYMNQYHPQVWRQRVVMNDPIVYYNHETGLFGSCSSLTPLSTPEVSVLELTDGCLTGNATHFTKAEIVAYLMDNDSDDLWSDVCQIIEDDAVNVEA